MSGYAAVYQYDNGSGTVTMSDYEYKILEEAKHVRGANAGASGAASRLTFSKVICQRTGRDIN